MPYDTVAYLFAYQDGVMSLHGVMLGAKAPTKIQEVTLMRPIHGNL